MTSDINALLRECKSLLVKWPESVEVAAKIDTFLAADMVAVPREPTEKMLSAPRAGMVETQDLPRQMARNKEQLRVYKAMIAAAEGE